MTGRYPKPATILVALAGLANTVLIYLLFIRSYRPLVDVYPQKSVPGYVIPALTDPAMIGGVLWFLAAVGFVTHARWAWASAVAGSVLSLASSFFPSIPMLACRLPPAYCAAFLPNLVFFFVLHAWVNPIDRRILWLSFISGMTTVLCFMNGAVSMSKLLSTGMDLYIYIPVYHNGLATPRTPPRGFHRLAFAQVGE
ncbi:MAG: hypothetical protein AB1445_11360 [Bacillota bacterium]